MAICGSLSPIIGRLLLILYIPAREANRSTRRKETWVCQRPVSLRNSIPCDRTLRIIGGSPV